MSMPLAEDIVIVRNSINDVNAVMAELSRSKFLAVGVWSKLQGQGESIDSIQADNGSTTYVFKVCQMSSVDVIYLMEHLKPLLSSSEITKVMHDCRTGAYMLYNQHKIRLAGPIFDTQVAHALLQSVDQIGCSDEHNSFPRLDLVQMLESMERVTEQLDTAKHAMPIMRRLWLAASTLRQQVGERVAQVVERLSHAASVSFLDESEQGLASGKGSYAAAARLPVGVDLEFSIDPEKFTPKFSLAGSGKSITIEKNTAEKLARPEDDGELLTVLSLFPQAVCDEVIELCSPKCVKVKLQCHQKNKFGQGVCVLLTVKEQGVDQPRWPTEITVDIGRPVRVRFGSEEEELNAKLSIEEALINLSETKGIPGSSGNIFYSDNRTGKVFRDFHVSFLIVRIHTIYMPQSAGIANTLHRISAMRGRDGEILGLTYRIGRHIKGSSLLIMDILASLASNSGSIMTSSGLTKSLLLLGPPGVGKTTLLRDISYTLADIFRKRVIVVDSSNEIGGDGDVPHECIGWRARRMQVPKKELQHRILTEAVQNHTPQVLIIDEIGTKAEVEAARKHSQAGVMLIGTAHGIELTTLLKNPELNGLIGGLHEVVVGDAAMRNARYSRRNRDENRDENAYDDTRKTKTERRGAPTFTTIIEVLGYDAYRVHMNTAESVDALLNGRQPQTQLRWKTQDGRFMAKFEGPTMKTSSKIPIHEPFTVASKPTEADWLTQLITLSSCLSRSQN